MITEPTFQIIVGVAMGLLIGFISGYEWAKRKFKEELKI